MFNMYQELVDRIDELLKQRKKKENTLNRFKTIYGEIPKDTIQYMYDCKLITEEEKIFWEILQMRKEKEKNVSNNNQN